MFTPKKISPEKETLLLQVFSDIADRRIDFFSKKLTLKQLKDLVELRNMVFENGQTKPHALNNYHLILSQHQTTDEFDAIFNLIVKGKKTAEEIILTNPGRLQRQNVSHFSGSLFPMFIMAMTIFAFSKLLPLVNDADKKINNAFDSNRAKGLCVLQETACEGEDAYGDVCYGWRPIQEGINCQIGNYFLLLCAIPYIILPVSLLIYFNLQDQKLFKSMLATCNDAKYDLLLNEILLDADPKINWSEKIIVNGTSCSIRQLALSLLLCFDDRMYAEFLPSFARQLQAGKRNFSVQCTHEKTIQSVVSLREQHTTDLRAPRF